MTKKAEKGFWAAKDIAMLHTLGSTFSFQMPIGHSLIMPELTADYRNHVWSCIGPS